MQFTVTYRDGRDKYEFAGSYSKNFIINHTTQITVEEVQYGRPDFPYLKLLYGSKETLIPKDSVVRIDLIK